MSTTTCLRTPEAIPLAHALIDEIAARRGIRTLFIKGPSADWWGLREPRLSADADVLVDPARLAELVEALCELGWYERSSWSVQRVLPVHSVTLIHENWPCDLDVHSQFPGIFVAPQIAFEQMWATRVIMPIAGVEVHVPSKAMSACILALHAVRSPESGRSVVELPALVARVRESFDATELAALDEAAGALRARTVLASFLTSIGLESSPDLTLDERRVWALRLSEKDATSVWVIALTIAPWRERPRLLFEALTYVDPAIGGRGAGRIFRRGCHRIRRLSHGLRDIGGAVRRVWAARTGRLS